MGGLTMQTIKPDTEASFVTLTGGHSAGVCAQSVVLPRITLDDPRFNYVPACKTDLRETFRRAREAMR